MEREKTLTRPTLLPLCSACYTLIQMKLTLPTLLLLCTASCYTLIQRKWTVKHALILMCTVNCYVNIHCLLTDTANGMSHLWRWIKVPTGELVFGCAGLQRILNNEQFNNSMSHQSDRQDAWLTVVLSTGKDGLMTNPNYFMNCLWILMN